MFRSYRNVSGACQEPPSPSDDVKRVVTLVHGTMASHADWIQDGRKLPRALPRVASTVLHRFCWTG